MHSNSKLLIASEIMNPSVFCLAGDLPIGAAIRALLRRGFSGAPVVDEDGRLCGVLSERDCLRVLAEAAFHGMPEGAVKAHMTRDVVSVGPRTDIFTLVALFDDAAVRRVPVVADGRVLGLITRRDALRVLSDLGGAEVAHGREPQEIAAVRSAV